jgi:hypothetical protein
MSKALLARRSRFALALAACAALAGCDSAEVDPPAAGGPTVQFATGALTAAEDTTVTLPILLTGGTGAPVTVEVLFAAGASSATLGDDFTGFGAPNEDSLQIATVTFSGAAEETREVTFTVAPNTADEVEEQAVFALQQAHGAALGEDRTLTVTILGPVPEVPPTIAEVRAIPNLETVTAHGIVTRAFGRLTYIQDGTAGIAIFAFTDSPFGTAIASGFIAPGDSIRVTGKLCEFGVVGFPDNIEPGTGLSQITAPSDECFSEDDIGEGEVEFQLLADGDASDVPAPQAVTLAEIAAAGDGYESELVRVTGLTIDPAGDFAFQASKSYTVTDPTGSLILRTPSGTDTQIAGVPIPVDGNGDPLPFTFEGVVGQFQTVNQLSPVYPTDIIPE